MQVIDFMVWVNNLRIVDGFLKFHIKTDGHANEREISIELKKYAKLINNQIFLELDGQKIAVKSHRFIGRFHKKLNYIPFQKQIDKKNKKLKFLRLDSENNVYYVERPLESVELTAKYKIFESFLISFTLFVTAGLIGVFSRITRGCIFRKKILLYEKFASSYQEGVLELSEKLSQSSLKGRYKFYFIYGGDDIVDNLSNNVKIVKKWSLHYYYLLYRSNFLIGADAPIHLTVLRSQNLILRFKLWKTPFIFLQHGVTYLKRQGKLSTYKKGAEGEPSYIVASSEKEAQVLQKDLNLSRDQIILSGMIQFDKLEYSKSTRDFQNAVTIMFTWKPWDEGVLDFHETSYYKTLKSTVAILQELQLNFKVAIHPKVKQALFDNDREDNNLDGNSIEWITNESIDELLKKTKLLITDYSSVCYPVYYQGGEVIFYQNDLERYESLTGKLIPKQSEWIGQRVYNLDELRKILTSIRNHQTNIRDEKTDQIFDQIISFHDGKNTDRLVDWLINNL